MDTCWERRRSALGAVLLVVGAVAGARLTVAPEADDTARVALSPYREGGFTVRAAAVDPRVDIASAEDGSWALGHSPAGGDVVLDLDLLAGDAVKPWWVDPVAGTTLELAEVASSGVARFTVPSGGVQDWVLVVDDAAAGYDRPGLDDVRTAIGSGSGGEWHPRDPGRDEGAPRDTDPAGAGDGGPRDEQPGDEQPGGKGYGDVDSGGKGSGGKGSDQEPGGVGSGVTGSGTSDDGREGHPRGPGRDEGAPRDTNSGEGTGGKAGDGPASGTAPEERRFAGEAGKGESAKPAPEESAPAKPAPAKPAPAKPAPEKPAPEKVPEQSAPEKAAPEKAEPEKAAGGSWDALAECESSGDWSISTGNGYHGGLQFDKGTWSDFGGTAYATTADGASKEQQIEVAEKVRDSRGGYGSWPACASKLGLPK